MKTHLILLLLAAVLPVAASAQYTGVRTRQDCTRHCTASELSDNPKMDQYAKQLEQVHAQLKTETDPDKKKALARQEQDILEQRDDTRERICRVICSHNPEE